MYTVYALQSQKRKYIYVGLTSNLQRRIQQHQEGKERTTRSYKPFKLVHFEEFPTRQAARNREKWLKSGIGKEWLKKHISQSDLSNAQVAKLVDAHA